MVQDLWLGWQGLSLRFRATQRGSRGREVARMRRCEGGDESEGPLLEEVGIRRHSEYRIEITSPFILHSQSSTAKCIYVEKCNNKMNLYIRKYGNQDKRGSSTDMPCPRVSGVLSRSGIGRWTIADCRWEWHGPKSRREKRTEDSHSCPSPGAGDITLLDRLQWSAELADGPAADRGRILGARPV